MSTNQENTQKSQVEKKKARKASTNKLPMVDLGMVLDFVGKIESDGLQTLTVHEVAKRMGFASVTSTPFYRRVVAAKLFGLLDTTQGVNLTKLALDYFKPTDDESKAAALATAMKNVVAYQKILERYSGKRLPQVDILANLIEREFNLASEAAKVCGSVFVNSAQRAGLVRGDGTLSTAIPERAPAPSVAETTQLAAPRFQGIAASRGTPSDYESHFLTLDAKAQRRVILQAPPVITESELKRIQNWLAVQFHVVESLDQPPPEQDLARESAS
ncbi:MAG: hypothetical protein DME76_10155 [Verrucomicrobia bacterium]|nr:MAG: hypothetical protein DME76_10155 [Verrucomicrobiota bacterium]